MEKLVSTDLPFSSSGKSLALAINGGSRVNDLRHLSFVYKTFNGVKQLHLGFHRDLRWHDWRGKYHCYEFNGIDPIVQETFAEYLEALAAANFGEECNISYSGVYEDDLRYFDGDMKYVDNGLGSGLTCATFVLAVMKAFGLQLVRAESWPRDREQDRRWLDWILGELRRS
ncbi:hypothetical protein [Delftia sp.]|uniref:hypothetical protein n=1 Tax=Delftia sp. TaxID=1886637 RepID=UPI00259CD027|nr:hypothetical protein [Delftia sp.]